jgi:hypothetical protein
VKQLGSRVLRHATRAACAFLPCGRACPVSGITPAALYDADDHVPTHTWSRKMLPHIQRLVRAAGVKGRLSVVGSRVRAIMPRAHDVSLSTRRAWSDTSAVADFTAEDGRHKQDQHTRPRYRDPAMTWASGLGTVEDEAASDTSVACIGMDASQSFIPAVATTLPCPAASAASPRRVFPLDHSASSPRTPTRAKLPTQAASQEPGESCSGRLSTRDSPFPAIARTRRLPRMSAMSISPAKSAGEATPTRVPKVANKTKPRRPVGAVFLLVDTDAVAGTLRSTHEGMSQRFTMAFVDHGSANGTRAIAATSPSTFRISSAWCDLAAAAESPATLFTQQPVRHTPGTSVAGAQPATCRLYFLPLPWACRVFETSEGGSESKLFMYSACIYTDNDNGTT